VLSDTEYSTVIDKDGAVVEIEVANTRIRGNVQLTKVDKDYPDNHLSGAVFEVYQDTDGDQKLGKDDTLLGTLEELTGGVYQMDSLLYGGYFVKEKTAPTGFVLDENAYYFAISENGKTVTVENEAGKGFLNAAQTGSIRIEKTSEDKVVKGFTFKVEGVTATGEQFSKEYVTDDNGEIHIEGLRVGDYVISEVSNDASAKYVLPDKVTVTVLEGKTTVAKFYNELKPVTPDVPKTGDTTNIALWAALCGLSLAGVGAAAFFGFRKKKNHESEDR
jgi:LPXTG-motif cell wall-anchored protein